MKKWAIAIFCFTSLFRANAQITDSAWAYWDSIYFVAHDLLSSKPDSTLKLAREYLQWAYHVEDQYEVAYSNDLLGSAFYYTNQLDSAAFHLHIAYDYFLALNDSSDLSSTLVNLGNAYSDKGHYLRAINYYLKSLEIDNALKETEGNAVVISNIANIFIDQKDYLNAEYYSRSALRISRKEGDYPLIATSLNQIAEQMIRENKLDSAQDLARESYNIAIENDLILELADAISIFGLVDQKLGLYDEAKEHLKESIKLTKGYNDPYSIVLKNNLLIDLYLETKEIDSARSLALESFALTRQTSKSRFMLMETTLRLSKVYEASSLPDLALSNLQDYVKYLDTIRSLNAMEAILSKNNIEIEKKNNLLNKNIELEKEAYKNNQLFLLITLSALGVGLALIILMIFLFQKSKNLNKDLNTKNEIILRNQKEIDDRKQEVLQKNMELSELIHNKDKLLAILTHDLKQPFNQLHYMLELLQLNVIQGKEKDEMLSDMKISLQNTRNTIDNLLIWSKSQFGGFEWKPFVVDLNKLAQEIQGQLKDQFKAARIKLSTELHPKPVNALIDKEQILIALRNLLNNSMKFSDPGSDVIIKTYISKNFACIEVIDFGSGMSKEQIEKLNASNKQILDLGDISSGGTGIGVLIVNEFIDNNNGRVKIKSQLGKGSSFTISFPLNQ